MIEEFTPVKGQCFTFQKIFEIYDAQFEALRDFVLSMGSSYELEVFTNSVAPLLVTENEVSSGTVFVYKNDDVLWDNEDFEIVSDREIRLLNGREVTDVIRVVIVKANFFKMSIEEYVETIKNTAQSATELYGKAQNLYNAFEEFFQRLDLKIADYVREKNSVEDLLSTLGSFVETLALRTQSYYEKTKAIADEIEGISGLTPEELLGTEVVLARNGAATLSQRLSKMAYAFEDLYDMRSCSYLRMGDRCLVAQKNDRLQIYVIDRAGITDWGLGKEQTLAMFDNMSAYLLGEFQNAIETMTKIPIQLFRYSRDLYFPRGGVARYINVEWVTNIVPSKVVLNGEEHVPSNNNGTMSIDLGTDGMLKEDSVLIFEVYGPDDSMVSREVGIHFRDSIYFGVVGNDFDFGKKIGELESSLIEDKDIIISGELNKGEYMIIAMSSNLSPKFWVDGICGGFEQIGTYYSNNTGRLSIYRTINDGLGNIRGRVTLGADSVSIVWEFVDF